MYTACYKARRGREKSETRELPDTYTHSQNGASKHATNLQPEN